MMVSLLAGAQNARSGRYAVAAGSLITASGGFSGSTAHFGFTGEIGIDVDTASGRATVASSSLVQHGVGSLALPLPAPDILKLSELEGRLRPDGSLRFTSPAGNAQEVDLVLTAEGDHLLLNGIYVEPCCDRFVFTFEDVRLIRIPRTVADAEELVLHDGRFIVRVAWDTVDQRTGTAHVAPLGAASDPAPATASDDSGVFYFFSPDNWELMVKVLDGCQLNNHHWVLTAASTTVGYEVTVHDSWADQTMTYVNPAGTTAQPRLDTSAFATCDVGEPE
jgi:hypothetical protein